MTSLWKRTTLAIIILAVLLRPLLQIIFWLNHAALDEQVGRIDLLSTEQLVSHVKGKSALLVGGTRGVGFGTALALAKAGAHVTVVGRSEASGKSATERITSGSAGSGSIVEFLQGDIGTVCAAKKLIRRLESSKKRYDFAVISAATFPDWSRPLQNDDGMDKSFAISVVGRFLLYRNLRRFMTNDARLLNVMASGEKLPFSINWDRDIASGKRNVTGLMESMWTFSLGNEIMLDTLYHKDKYFSSGKITTVSTHPGMLKTDLHRGQGLIFDIIEIIASTTTEEDAGVRQSSILVSEQLHQKALTLVDFHGYGRRRCPRTSKIIEENRDWLWDLLLKLENTSSACKN